MRSAPTPHHPKPSGYAAADAAPTAVAAPSVRSAPPAHRIVATSRLRTMLTELVEATGPHHLVVEWPLAARCLPVDQHRPGTRDVIIGHLASCAIFIDLQYLAWFSDHGALELDVDPDHCVAGDGTLRLLLHTLDGHPLTSNV